MEASLCKIAIAGRPPDRASGQPRRTAPPPERTEHALQLAALHGFHHPLHLGELFEQPIHVLHLRARTRGDPAPT